MVHQDGGILGYILSVFTQTIWYLEPEEYKGPSSSIMVS